MRFRTFWAVAGLTLIVAAGCGKVKKAPAPPTISGVPGPYPGTYAKSCGNMTKLDGGVLRAQCAGVDGKFILSYIRADDCHGDIGNSNGMLVCNGATASTTALPALPAAASSAAAATAASAVAAAPAAPASSDAPLKR